jgi:hypothetical protein
MAEWNVIKHMGTDMSDTILFIPFQPLLWAALTCGLYSLYRMFSPYVASVGLDRQEDLESFLKEAEIMQHFDHNNVVKLLGNSALLAHLTL